MVGGTTGSTFPTLPHPSPPSNMLSHHACFTLVALVASGQWAWAGVAWLVSLAVFPLPNLCILFCLSLCLPSVVVCFYCCSGVGQAGWDRRGVVVLCQPCCHVHYLPTCLPFLPAFLPDTTYATCCLLPQPHLPTPTLHCRALHSILLPHPFTCIHPSFAL